MKLKIRFVIMLLFTVFCLSCKSQSITESGGTDSGKWVSGVKYQPPGLPEMPHDNRIYQTEHFQIFSDSSSDASKIKLALICEEAFNEILQLFNSTAAQLGVGKNGKRIQVWGMSKTPYSTVPFPFGFIVYAYDHPRYTNADTSKLRSAVKRLVKHEAVHVYQYLLGNSLFFQVPFATWFYEGIAENISGGVFKSIEKPEEIISWKTNSARNHPIDMNVYQDFSEGENFFDYYPFFHLAVDYILDNRGLGKSYKDVKKLIIDVITTRNFSVSFEKCIGISLKTFRDNYYDLMTQYLNNKS